MPPVVKTARDIIDCLERVDLSESSGRKAMWAVMGRCGLGVKGRWTTIADQYRADGMPSPEANRLAALDIAASLPSAADLPDGLLVSLGGSHEPAETIEVEAFNGSVEGICEKDAAGKVGGQTAETQVTRLVLAVAEASDGRSAGIGASVVWVSANLCIPINRIDVATVPGPEALALLLWARPNETEFRRLYDCKRIPSRGIAEDDERGFVDNGAPIADVLRKLGEVVDDLGRSRDAESVRHLPEVEQGCDDGGAAGGVSDLHSEATEGARGAVTGPGG